MSRSASLSFGKSLVLTGFACVLLSGAAHAQLPGFTVPDDVAQTTDDTTAPSDETLSSDTQPLLPGAEAQAPDSTANETAKAPDASANDTAQAPEVAPVDNAPGTDLPIASINEDPAMTLDPADASSNPGFNLDVVKSSSDATPKSKTQLDAEKRKEAFDAALKGLLPLSPQEIREMLEQFDRTQESVETPIYPAPKPEVAVETVSLDPGAKPLVIKVAYGNVTTLNMLDISGSPWPIEDISWAGNFEIADSSASKSGAHILRITPQSEFATGNISIRMLTLKTPIIISLETSRDIVHYRFDAIVPEYGPMAEVPLIDQGISITAGDTNMSSVLQGVIPEGAQKLSVSGIDGRTTAYDFNGQTFIRTPLSLLSPSWSASVASADGMRVYTIKKSPVILLSDKGKTVRARLSARENLLEGASHE